MNLTDTINKLIKDERTFTFRMDIESNPIIRIHAPIVGMENGWIYFDGHDNSRTGMINNYDY